MSYEKYICLKLRDFDLKYDKIENRFQEIDFQDDVWFLQISQDFLYSEIGEWLKEDFDSFWDHTTHPTLLLDQSICVSP